MDVRRDSVGHAFALGKRRYIGVHHDFRRTPGAAPTVEHDRQLLPYAAGLVEYPAVRSRESECEARTVKDASLIPWLGGGLQDEEHDAQRHSGCHGHGYLQLQHLRESPPNTGDKLRSGARVRS
jgi:hypothetical protein